MYTYLSCGLYVHSPGGKVAVNEIERLEILHA